MVTIRNLSFSYSYFKLPKYYGGRIIPHSWIVPARCNACPPFMRGSAGGLARLSQIYHPLAEADISGGTNEQLIYF
jgi:hypothetical protein